MYDEIIAAGETSKPRTLDQIETLITQDKNASTFVVGQARYADVFGNQYISGFCYFLNERSMTFQAMGGTAHNYRRKLNDEEIGEAEARWEIWSAPA